MSIRSQTAFVVLLQAVLLACAVPAKPATEEHVLKFHPVADDQYESVVRAANIPMGDVPRQFMPFPGGQFPGGRPSQAEIEAKENLGQAIKESLEWIMPNVGYTGGLQKGAVPLCVVQFVNLTEPKTSVQDGRADVREADDEDSNGGDSATTNIRGNKMNGQPVVVCAVMVPQTPPSRQTVRRKTTTKRKPSSTYNRKRVPARPATQYSQYPGYPAYSQYSRDFEHEMQIPAPVVGATAATGAVPARANAAKGKSEVEDEEDDQSSEPTGEYADYGAFFDSYGGPVGAYSGVYGGQAGAFSGAYGGAGGVYGGYGPYPLPYQI